MLVAEAGAAPLCPHTMFRYFDGTLNDDFWLKATLELLRRCDAIVMLPTWRSSSGARGEHGDALSRNLPILDLCETHGKGIELFVHDLEAQDHDQG